MKVNADCFTWSKTRVQGVGGRVGVAEASDLPFRGRASWLEVYNPATGRTVRWEHVREVRCGTIDDELLADVYKASAGDVQRDPRLRFCELRILND